RMKSSYAKRNITVRTHYADGSNVTDGPAVSATYPLGYFREDYQYNTTSASTPDYLDEHNGRFCVTPEYPNGIYAYFSTVDANWNSAYPYIIGPTFYGTKTAAKVTSITETVTTYVAPTYTVLNLQLYIEGMLTNGSMNPSLLNSGKSINALLADTITVQLRQTISPYSLVESVKGILKTDGTCVLNFSASRTGNSYYITIKQRNGVETWSKNPVSLAASTSYNLKQ
ncbi:MAG: YHYH protein, partial [Bacteroidota bacterium]